MVLFTLSLIIYAFVTLLIKVAMKTFEVTPQELVYYVSIVVCLCFYTLAKTSGHDVLKVPVFMYKSIFFRILAGFFSDIFLFLAFTYTSYSKGIVIYFTNTLMIPFFGRCILKEKILKVDILAIALGFVGMVLIIQPYKIVQGDQLPTVE